MGRETGPMFVDRRAYRRRRVADAARLLPVLGAILFTVPLLWQGQAETAARTSHVLLFLFVVWVLLAGLAAVISRRLEHDDDGNRNVEGR